MCRRPPTAITPLETIRCHRALSRAAEVSVRAGLVVEVSAAAAEGTLAVVPVAAVLVMPVPAAADSAVAAVLAVGRVAVTALTA